jgi:hypothetical protein
MRILLLVVLICCLFFMSCRKKHESTEAICSGLFREVFNVNPMGVDSHYVTDSTTFRLYVGRVDNEHENYSYTCIGDSLKIEKVAVVDMTSVLKPIETRYFIISQLKKDKKFQ